MKNLTELIDTLKREVTTEFDHIETVERRKTIFYIILPAIVFGYLSWMYGMVKNLQTEHLTGAATNFVEDYLPEVRASLETQLIEYADKLQVEAEQAAVDFIDTTVEKTDEMIDAEIKKHKDELRQMISTQLRDLLLEYEKEHKDLSPRERAELYLVEMPKLYNKRMRQMFDAEYFEYSSDIRSLRDRLDRLKLGKNLTQKEKYERELLSCFVALVELKKKDGVGIHGTTRVIDPDEATVIEEDPADGMDPLARPRVDKPKKDKK